MLIREAILADAVAIARIHLDSWRTTYRGIMPDDYLRSLSRKKFVTRWNKALIEDKDRTFVYVVEDQTKTVIGFVSGGPSRSEELPYSGELYVLHIVKEHHKKGIGRHLVILTANRLAQMGMRSMFLWVISGNPAEQFYSRLGGKRIARREFELGGALLSEIGFGWEDTGMLRESEQSIIPGAKLC